MARKYDDFDEQDGGGMFDQILGIVSRRKREFAIVSVSAAVILFGLVVWGSYPDNEEMAQNESVPIVRAEAGDYKTTPENPGGMEIPYRDSTVFSSANDSAKDADSTENILADEGTEKPLPRSQLFAGLNTEGDQPAGAPPVDLTAKVEPKPGPSTLTADDDATAASATAKPQGEVEETMAKVEPVTPPPANDALVKEAIGTTPVPAKIAAVTPPAPVAPVTPKVTPPVKVEEAQKVAKIESAAGAASTAKAVQPGGYYIQLGSVRAETGAAGEWKKLQAKYTSLSPLKYRTQEANLGAKGTFYRIQAGPMSKESATDICASIKKSAPGACLVTK